MRERLRWYLRITRMRAGALAALPFGAGYLITGREQPAEAAAWWCFGLAYHAYACVLNDLADQRTDSLDPTRRGAPLVGGPLVRRHAVRAGVLLGAGQCAAVAFLSTSTRPALLALVALVTYGNLRQKRSAWVPPWCMDVLFGIAMAGPLVVVASTSGRPPAAVWLFAVAFGLQMDLFNGVAGNVKDLAHDHAVGARTTALALGVRPAGAGIRFTRRYGVYCLGLWALGAAAAVAAVVTAEAPHSRTLVLAAGVGALHVLSLVSLSRLLAGRRPPSRTGRDPFLLGQFLGIFVVLAAFAGPVRSAGLPALVVAWTALFPRLERLLAAGSESRVPAARGRAGTRESGSSVRR